MHNEHNKILQTVKQMTAAFENGKIDDVLALYEPSSIVLFEPDKPQTGHAQLQTMFSAMAVLEPKFEFSGHDIIVNGDLAVHISPWSMHGTQPDGQKIEQSGLSIAILRKQEDGSWKFVIDNPHGAKLLQAQH